MRPGAITEVKPADSSTSLAPLIDGLPATEDKIGFLGCGIMATGLTQASAVAYYSVTAPTPFRLSFWLELTHLKGAPMAMNLIRTGHDVSVWNRTIDKTKALKELGATVYETKRQIVENCDIVFDLRNIKKQQCLTTP